MNTIDHQIEILGQKLSYPSTYQGTAAVFFVCLACLGTVYLVTNWATPKEVIELQILINKSAQDAKSESERSMELQRTIDKRDQTIKVLKADIDSLITQIQAKNALSVSEKEAFEEKGRQAEMAVIEIKSAQESRLNDLLKKFEDTKNDIEFLDSSYQTEAAKASAELISNQQQRQLDNYKSEIERLQIPNSNQRIQ